jgi:hypothetical protein
LAWKYSNDIIHRKLSYVANLASFDGINLSMDKWISILQDIQLEISYETIYRLLEELYLLLNSGFDWSDFDFPFLPDDFDWPDIIDPPVEETGKAYYEISYYGTSYYDPPDITFKQLERFAWDNRYAVSEKDVFAYKKQSTSLVSLLEAKSSGLTDAGLAGYMPSVVHDVLAMVESRILNGFYVGFAIVGLSKVATPPPIGVAYRGAVATRNPQDWKIEYDTESVISWESLVGWARVGHCRVGAWYQVMNKVVSDEAVKRINDFWLRSGMVTAGQLSQYGGIDYTIYGSPSYGGYAPQEVQTLWQRVFMIQRVDQYHYAGGASQLKMQYNVKKIRPILDRAGIAGTMRMGYMAFAQEIYHFDKDSHKLYKQWKQLLTQDDIRIKYVRLGLDETVLSQIQGMVRP